ncbi:MAG: patatin-like phospholipase family protein [Candidatus Rokubacteria bacterium]|nr:patatin-like phospholipase family protein [Candidatus Rokubacteria bacterium]
MTFVGILFFGWAVGIRIDWKESFWAGLIFIVFIVLVEILTLPLSRYAIKHQVTPWFQFAMGVTLIPVLVAWGGATVFSWLNPRLPGAAMHATLEDARQKQLSKRQEWARHPGWMSTDGRPIVIAVTLSGGGYRAAAIHAGLLHALDERCVPIRYLSTVSGGSIIGTYYALGYPPALFREKLMAHRPGLPDEMLSIHWVFADWFLPGYWVLPGWNSADTYARHFRNVFFGTKTLADTGSFPRLLVNATDIEQTADRAREVFYKGRDPKDSKLDETLLADVVAASGAFPGAFQPKVIRWLPPAGADRLEKRRFVDGGVVENLGIEGLERFRVLEQEAGKSVDAPDFTIISDASKYGTVDRLPPKVEFVQLVSRSQGITYGTLHEFIRRQLKKEQVLWMRATHAEGIAILGSYMFGSVNGSKVASEVAGYETLKELSSQQVDRTFWVGYTLGQHYWDSVNSVRERLGGAGSSCPGVQKAMRG